MSVQMNIAIDGPAGAGKSTVAKMLADKLFFVYIDTGAMYRALTYTALDKNINVNDEKALLQLLKEIHIKLENNDGTPVIKVNGDDVTEAVRTYDVTNNVSYVAKHAMIRREMVLKQQELARDGGTVMDGRDIGTAVLPDAEVKIFLTASVEERARRRHEENLSKGMHSDYDRLKEEIANRDKIDSERSVAPLKKAEDAVEIDTTLLSINEVVEKIFAIVSERNGTLE